MQDDFRLVLSTYYPIHFSITIILQVYLLFLLIRHTPVQMRGLRIFLLKTSLVEVTVAILIFLTQSRLIVSNNSVAILCYGPIKSFDSVTCHYSYCFLQFFALANALSIADTIYYKYHNVFRLSEKYAVKRLLVQFFISSTPALAIVTLSLTAQKDASKIALDIKTSHSEYEVPENVPIAGFSNMSDPHEILAVVIIALVAYGVPVFCLLSKNKIVEKLRRNREALSEHTTRLIRTFATGLTFQSLVPVVCYVPVITGLLLEFSEPYKKPLDLLEHYEGP
ncbi:unnamed protein product [Caenorhabditis auriculariae]|uniref:G-protein coupled receptors family 1 profile domain-containing protein n=1 Tax=Caenorhabditis auriculariae TaxID=2777116 RepID=A0A8S1HDC0_9PELO|nr:unnamed protein product [Caenorhabditis auriculariae]